MTELEQAMKWAEDQKGKFKSHGIVLAEEIQRLRTELEAERAEREMQEPVAWARKWHIDGVTPQKERRENGRWAWPAKFKLLPVTTIRCACDDVPLYAEPHAT